MKTNFFSRAQTGAAKTVTNFMGITDASKAAAKALRDADRGKDISVFGIFHKVDPLSVKNIFTKGCNESMDIFTKNKIRTKKLLSVTEQEY